MAAFAALLGGAGQAATQYGQQMRGILEERREGLSSIAQQLAANESDPTLRAQHLQAAADLLAGKDMGKIVPQWMKAVQTHQQNSQALAQSIGMPAQKPQPSPQPGPAQVGQVPGTPPQPAVPQPPAGLGGAFDNLIAGNFKPEQPSAPPAAQTTQTAVPTKAEPIQANPPAIQPVAPRIPSIDAVAQQQAPLTALATPQAPITDLANPPGLPVPEDPQKIRDETFSNPMWAAPANRPAMLAVMNQRLAHQETLRQAIETRQADLAYKRAAVAEVLKQSPNLPDAMKASLIAEAGGLPGLQLGSYLRPVNTPGDVPSSSIPPEQRLDIHGQPIDVNSSPYVREHRDLLSGTVYYSPSIGPVQTVLDTNGQMVNSARLPGAVAGGGASPISMLNPVNTGVNGQGQNVYQIRRDLMSPHGVAGAGTNPAFIPTNHQSISQTPGQLPTTTNSRTFKGAGSPAAGASGAVAPGGLIAQEYKDWVSGAPLNPAQQTAARAYAQQNGLPTPTFLNARGQGSAADLDPIIAEAQRTRDMLADRIKNGLSKADMAKEYAKYAYLRINGPETDLISNLSFSGLRSAAQAMKGSGSKAYPVLNRALEHTPVVGLNPDSPAQMLNKLDEMLTRLKEGKESVLADERKNGAIQALPQTQAPIKPLSAGGIRTVNTKSEYDALPKGSVYIDAQDGQQYTKGK